MPAPGLLEREEELRRVRGGLAAAASGRPAVVVIEAAAGLGKTSLLHAVADDAPDGLRALTARPAPHEAAHAYGVVRQMLGPCVVALDDRERAALARGPAAGGLAVVERGAAQQSGPTGSFGVVDGLYWLVAALAERRPLALVVDDGQWVDAPSLRFLGHLLRRMEGLAVVVVLALRPAEPGAPAELLDPLRLDPRAEVVRLRPLSRSAVGRLVGGDEVFATACHGATAGNPLYLRELVRELEARASDREVPTRPADVTRAMPVPGPASVARHVGRRIASLGAGGVALVEAAAVLGDGVPFGDAVAVAGLDRFEAMGLARALERMEVLASTEPVRFAHPIVASAVRDGLDAADEDRLLRRAVAHLQATGATPERIAAPLLELRPGGGAPTAPLTAAAGEALARGAPDVAAVLLRRALAEPPPAAELPAVLHALANVEQMLADPLFGATMARAVAVAPDDATRLAWTLELAVGLGTTGALPRAVDVIEGAMSAPWAADADAQDALGAHLCCLAWGSAVGHPRAHDLLRRFATAPPRDAPAALLARGVRAARMDLPVARLVPFAEAALRAPVVGPAGFLGHLLANGALIFADQFAVAGRRLQEQLVRARAVGDVRALGAVHVLLADLAFATGDLAACEGHVGTYLGPLGADPRSGTVAYGVGLRIRALVERGALHEAETALAEVGAEPWLPTSHAQYFLRAARGRLRRAQGRLEEAVDDFARARECLQRFSGTAWSPIGFDGADEEVPALVALGRAQEARALVLDALPRAREAGPPRNLAATLRTAALLAAVDGIDVVGAQDPVVLAEEAVRTVAGTGARLEQARCLLVLGMLQRRAGRRGAAREPLGLAADLAADCGAVTLTEAARAELAASGARPRRERLTTGRESLTPSEARVAGLAATGRTNREVAQDLYLSVKTVEMHLGRAYRKLGVTGRAELAAALG